MEAIGTTWNLADIFASPEEWEAARLAAGKTAEGLEALRGRVTASCSSLLEALRLSEELNVQLERLYVYASCGHDANMADSAAKDRYETICQTLSGISERLAFLDPELMGLPAETFAEWCGECTELERYRRQVADLLERREHVLDEQGEALLVRLNDLKESYQKIFDDLIVNDVRYPELTNPEGKTVTVNDAAYGAALLSPDREYRKKFFTILLGDIYGGHINTLASNYYALVKGDVYLAKSRRYPSARAYAMAENHIPEEVYNNLVENVRASVGPLQDYVSLRKRVLGLEDFYFYDFFVPLVKDTDRRYTYEEACNCLLEATAPLGTDYTALCRRSIDECWSEVYPHKNKVSGAYSTGAYGIHPFMLLNFDGTLDDVFTLVHETGHSLHTWYSNEAQPPVNANYSIFCAEVASTTNEMLLYHYLLDHAQTREEKALLLSKHLDDIRSTFYRQTMFADFELQTHRIVEEGRPLLPDGLCEIHRKLNADYYGPEFGADKTISYEWARIPHFYRAFYVYQYATGISAAIAISRRILAEGEGAVRDYKKFLSAGSSVHPIEALGYAGVDMASPQPVLDTAAEFAETLHELEKLL